MVLISKLFRNICFALLSICSFVALTAQPSAPTVNGLGYAKFVDFPISPFTGTFSYSVPIASVTSGSLSLPISIDYHSGGNKVGDPASNVGLGWNLNYGGSITRTIIGVADEIPNRGYWFDPTPNVTSLTFDDEENVAEGDKDGEPDIFTWVAGGQGGKFYFDRSHNLVNITKTNAKIERLGGVNIFNLGFKITLSNGIEYFFTLFNTQAGLYQDYDIVEFVLTKVRSFDSRDSILFSYHGSLQDEIYKVKYIAMPIKHRPVSTNDWDALNTSESHYVIRQKRLDQIIGSNNKVTIEYSTRNDLEAISSNADNSPKRISGIKYENGTFCTKHLLDQTYFKDNPNTTNPYHQRLKLDGIQKVSCQTSTNVENPITFEYNGPSYSGIKFFPSIYDKNIDHFGYYNKKGTIENNFSNCDMIQNTTLTFASTSVSQGNANRSPNAESSLIGQLEKVNLPTKGAIRYFYEPNSVNSSGSFSSTAFNLSCVCSNPQVSTWRTIDIDMKNTGFIYVYGTAPSVNSGCGTYSPKYVYINIYNSQNSLIYANSLMGFSSSFNMSIPLTTINQIVAGENYKFEIYSTYCDGSANLTYTNSGNVEAPGNRIKEILITDNINSANDILKKYNYGKFSANNQSSGILVNNPQYGVTAGLSFVFSAHSLKSLQNLDGYGVGYENVTIDYNGIGKEKLTFYKEATTPPYSQFPYPPSQVLQGRQLSSEKQNSSDNTVSSEVLLYDEEFVNSDYFHKSMHLFSIFYAQSSYRLKTNRWVRVTSETTTTDGVSTTTNHIYDTSPNTPILGPVISNMTNSDGKVTKTYTRYTSQYDPYSNAATIAIKNALIAKNIHIPYEVKVEVDGINFLSGARTEFNLFDPSTGISSSAGIPRPSKEMKYERTWNSAGVIQSGTWTTQKTFSKYAHKGKLTEYNDFGYSATTLQYDPASYNVTKKTFIAHETQYEYYPNSTLLKKVTDIDGTNVSYEYDALIRLWKIIDNSKQITKTYSYYFGAGTSNDRHKTTVTTTFQGASNVNSLLSTLEDITYYDNLERTIQMVKKGQSPTNKDIITSLEYDKYGRVVKEYLPIEGSGATGSFLTIQPTWKHKLTTYEASPLSRKLSDLPPDWYATDYSYGSNTTANDGTITDPKSGYTYPQNSLYKTIVTDPNGNKSIAFKDKKGRTVLSAQYSGANLAASNASQKKIIQNVYDLKDRLEAVIVPGATWTTATDLNYYYRYDGEDKLIYKKLPSRGEIHYQYNSKDLIAGWRDNNVGTSKWFATQYDNYGRPLKTGFDLYSPFQPNSPTITDIYTETTYDGTTPIEKGKVKTEKSKILGSSPISWLQTTYNYDPTTGRLASTSGNHHLNVGNTSTALTSSYVYDKGGNVTNTNTGIISASGGTNLPVNYIDKYDHVGRNIENIFQYNSGTQTTLSKQVYNHREELIIKYQGKTGLTGVNEYLQEMNYTYLTNGLLKSINQPQTTGGITNWYTCSTPNPTNYSTYNDKDLFYLELFYDTQSWGSAPLRKNGEISGAIWQTKGRGLQGYQYVYDFLGQLKEAQSFDKDHAFSQSFLTNRFTENINYDERGNITSLTRYGVSSSSTCNAGVIIDQMTYNYTGQTGNRLFSISDATTGANGLLGFKPATGNYTYDANGNISADPYKGITSTIYNIFDKPTRINKSDGKFITFTYDGSGNMLSKSIFNAGATTPLEKRDYIGNFEYVNGVLESVMHSEGRYRSATAKHEYHFKDHLGNTRLVYCDLGATPDGKIDVATEILQESHYYPYGLEYQGHYIQQSGYDYRYKFNDIERLKDLDIGIDMAFYRGLDPTTGRWMQVDPKAEMDFGGSPYRHAFNNPISFSDTDGDFALHVGAAIVGAVVNTFNNWDKIAKNPWSAIGYVATGAVAGAVSLSPGGFAAAAKITAAGNLLTDVAGGNLPEIRNFGDAASYTANLAMNAFDVAGAGKIAKAGFKGLSNLGVEWAGDALKPYGEWVISDIVSSRLGSTADGFALSTDFDYNWVTKVGFAPVGFGSGASKSLGITIDPKDQIDRSLLNKPDKRGNAPTFKNDGTKVEIHHVGQNPNGPFKEMHWEDHRGKGVDNINHPNKGGKSQIPRSKFDTAKKGYWRKVFDLWK